MSKPFTITIKRKSALKALGLLLIAVIAFNQLFTLTFAVHPKIKLTSKNQNNQNQAVASNNEIDLDLLRSQVLPAEGVTLPITWGDLGKRMIADGVIDEEKFRKVFPNGLESDEELILNGNYDQQIVMTAENSRFLLDILWAFGLANKNDILENGEMTDKKYGGDASKFAATGGWSLSSGKPMDHYSQHEYVSLNKEQQDLVDRVSRGIYRPCCGNSTHFPDCNHGMAMLGLLELLAAEGLSEEEIFQVALQVNSYWFPQTYVDLATYFKEQGSDWKDVDPKMVLAAEYSSGKGYQQTRQSIKSLPQPVKGGGSCGA
jgi:hypothetical protein